MTPLNRSLVSRLAWFFCDPRMEIVESEAQWRIILATGNRPVTQSHSFADVFTHAGLAMRGHGRGLSLCQRSRTRLRVSQRQVEEAVQPCFTLVIAITEEPDAT